MKTNFTLFFLLVVCLFSFRPAASQCTAAELNWDNLDFLPSNNTRYTSFYPSAAFPYTQHFAIGTRKVSFSMAPANIITLNGENGNNTAHTGSFAAAGDDVHFTTNSAVASTITFTFDAEVENVRFSIFDVDQNQRVAIVATDASSGSENIGMVRASGTSGITVAGSGTATPVATGSGADYAGNDNRGTINISIAGPVKQVVIRLSAAAGDVWLSDIDACVTGSFAVNYQAISRPFTNQPQYVLAVVNNNIYYVDPTNGRSYFLFNEPGHNRLNSMAYDPYKREVYYTYSLGSDPRNDRTLKKYNVDTKTISIVMPNVNAYGIPTYESGVESGAATFYGGSLYLGVEGYTGTSGSGSYAAGRKSTIWKIDFDAAGNPIAPAVQVWGITADNGTNAQNIHDWSDFGITNGKLIDFDGSQSGDIQYFHTDLMTGVRTDYLPAGGVIPRQVSIGWDEKLYNVDNDIALYNNTTGVGVQYVMFAPLGPVIPTGGAASWGDAAGPYRPFLDFGDAPASYDPNPLSPACHDTLTPTVAGRRTKMILGANEDVEWLKKGFTTVEDNFEDGLAFVPLFAPASNNYLARVSVLNNTGQNATVCAWLDYNGNGVFDASEGITPINVSSSAAVQLIDLNWPGIASSLLTGSMTHLRIRITAASFGMNQAHATGYYDMGEVEDYQVIVNDFPLPHNLLSFEARPTSDKKALLEWTCTEETGFMGYDLERSSNGSDWEWMSSVAAAEFRGTHNYTITDHHPFPGKTWYRLRLKENNQAYRYSALRMVSFSMPGKIISLYPNPAKDKFNLVISNGSRPSEVGIDIYSISGAVVLHQRSRLVPGENIVPVSVDPALPAGTYIVRTKGQSGVNDQKLVIYR